MQIADLELTHEQGETGRLPTRLTSGRLGFPRMPVDSASNLTSDQPTRSSVYDER